MQTESVEPVKRPALSTVVSHDSVAHALNKWTGYLKYKKTQYSHVLSQLKHKIIGIFSGNQGGKTSGVAKLNVDCVIGNHKDPERVKLMRKVRCMSSTLPSSANEEEQDNTQYLELKKLIPYEMIISDITARTQNLVVRRPLGLNTDKTIFEFRSSKQELQDLGKIQLSGVWHDEETPKRIREECRMRLLVEGGWEIFSLTPINYLSYTFDEVWEKKSFLYRSQTIVDKFGGKQVDHIKGGKDVVACIQIATDDNPVLTPEDIELIFEGITDPDELALRRYGVFKQVSGRVHKTYDPRYCYIDYKNYFPNGVPYNWVHARGIDYHESRLPWSIGWLSASPEDEWFLWQEWHPAIDGTHAMNTYEISKGIVRRSLDYEYIVNLIDPLANKKQANTLFSTTDDINRHLHELRAPAFWQGWDTKGTTGRDEISKRFKNAVTCGRPLNNAFKEAGMIKHRPTLWICNTCPDFHKSIMNWRYGEWATAATQTMNDPKPTPMQRNSHDNMVLEGLAKDQRLLLASHFMKHRPPRSTHRPVSVTGR